MLGGVRKKSISPTKPSGGQQQHAHDGYPDSRNKDLAYTDSGSGTGIMNGTSNTSNGLPHAFPLMGAGSRSKILHQLGEPVDLLSSSGGKPSAGTGHPPPTGSSHISREPSYGTSGSSSGNVSPLDTRERSPFSSASPSKPKHPRRVPSGSGPKLSFNNLAPLYSNGISPTSTPWNMVSGSIPTPPIATVASTTSSYFDFPEPTQGAHSARQHASPSSLLMETQSSRERASRERTLTSRSISSTSLNKSPSKTGALLGFNTASNPSFHHQPHQKSAPPGVQTFKIGLPPVDASPRTIFSGSPSMSPSPSTDRLAASPSASGLVGGARSDSVPDLEGPSPSPGSMGKTQARWPSMAGGSQATELDAAADDGQLEEIVPWLYQGSDGRRPGSPSTISSPPRSRHPSMANNARPSVSGMLRPSKSASNMKSVGRSDSTPSLDGLGAPVERERKASGRFMGMLRKKSSAIAVNFSSHHKEEGSDTHEPLPTSAGRNGSFSAGGSLSVATGGKLSSRPKMSPRSASALPEEGSSSKKRNNKKDKKREYSLPERGGSLPTGHTGVSLDTNLDEMEGIVNLDNLQPFPNGYSMASPYDHLNAVTANASSGGAVNSPKPGTPPSPSQLHGLRRPSLAGSTRFEFTSGDSTGQPDIASPLGKRLGLTRRDSVDIIGSMNRWSANGGLGAGPSVFADPARKASIISLGQADRASDGTPREALVIPDSGWTAPDSWAVKPSGAKAANDDDSDEELEQTTVDKAAQRSQPATPLLNGEADAEIGPKFSKRPGTGNSMFGDRAFGFTKPAAAHGSIRIFKPDNAHTILNVPLNITVSELHGLISKKPGFIPTHSKLPAKSYKLYCRARGLERMMASSEKPLSWQDRKFRAAGYDPETDRLEELGREDNSYLLKYIFKPEHLPLVRVEEEGLEGFDYIDLQARGLENLPIFLYKHAHELISLNLSRNARLHLPTDFVQLCTAMRDLKMVEMGMKRVPQSVRQISTLTRLDVSVNRIVDFEHCSLDETKELTTLIAYNNRITSLPDYFVRFQALKYLNISNNRFETFPVVVCEVTTLHDLDISFNSLSSLPPEIGKLRNLERLLIANNSITSLPSTMGRLTRLRELDCRRNLITDYAPINALPNVEKVRAQHNLIKALEMTVGTLSILNLSNNAITRFTVAAGDKPSALTRLNLSHARLETIPDDLFALCPNLHALVINDNKIRTLSESLGNLGKLAHLGINNNALQALPESVGKLQSLHTLDASNNKLTSVPESIWLCSELASLNLSSNNIVEFPDPPQPSAEEHEEAERKLSTPSVSRLVPSLSMSLRKLYLAYNRLRDDTFRPISLMSSLTMLNISSNDIYEIPPGMLQKCQQLTHLYLSGNFLTSLPADDLERLTNLRVLHLNGNKLQTLPAELGKIPSLFTLDVGNNALKYNIANWPYDWNWNWNLELRYLNLSGNKRLEIKPSAQSHQEFAANGLPLKKRNLSDFSALQKLRVLGLMDVTLMIPSVPDETEDRRVRTSLSSINEMGYGVADSLGATDHLSMIDMVVPKFRGKDDECVIGLFDAGIQDKTSGSKIAKFIVDNFVQRLTLELSRLRDEDASQGLRRTFLSLNRDWCNTIVPSYDRSRKQSDVLGHGERFQNSHLSTTTDINSVASAIVVYLYKNTLYVANVGNAMAVIAGRTMLARQLSTKHDPTTPEEVIRIRSCEGWVSLAGRVNDISDTARGFGYLSAFPAVNCEPAVHVLDLVDSDEFVIIANRGLWDAMSYQAAVDVCWEHREDSMLAAQKLRDMAIAYGAEGNVMVMVVNVGDLFRTKQPRINRGLALPSAEPDYYDKQYVARRVQGSIPGLRVMNETAAPQGTVALVFTDIRNSTALWETNPGMQNAMRIHHELLRRLIRAFDGYEVKTEGDAFMVSFSSVTSAALWCFTVQLELLRADWPVELIMSEEGKELYGHQGELIYRGLSVRMGLHWGAPICEQDPVNLRMDYLGPMVNRAARVSGVAEGGQITASADAVEVLRAMLATATDSEDEIGQPLVDPSELDAATKRDIAAIRQLGFGITELGERKLKGLETPEFLSLIYPNALASRLTGGKSKQELLTGVETSRHNSPVIPTHPQLQRPSLLDLQDMRNLSNMCLRLEALSAGPGHNLYELPSKTMPSNQNSPAIGFNTSTAAPRRRITLSSQALAANAIRQDASEEHLLVLLELFIVRIENVLSTLQLRQLGPFTEVLSALGDAIKTDPQHILHALSMLSQML